MKVQEINRFKEKALKWASGFEVCCCLDSNNYKDKYSNFDFLIAAGTQSELTANSGDAFERLKNFYDVEKDWMFGLFNYELKNEVEDLTSRHSDRLEFPHLYFFVPKYLIALQGDEVTVIKGPTHLIKEIEELELITKAKSSKLKLEAKISREEYLKTVNELKLHIKRGDIYEVNFCQEFFAERAQINPLEVYQALNQLSPTPFSGFFKIYDRYILSATPERFLARRGDLLISQPIKGTAKRHPDDLLDLEIRNTLKSSAKEQAENVMIVDLVRNDLTKSAVPGSVKVDELFGIYSFPRVHQMISTISCQLDPSLHFVDAIKNTFPIGSMTGAPKVKAMQLIDRYEASNRGAYSGSFGCISPNGNFDFNVVIRSILYNRTNEYLSFQVGGAITFAANAEDEYDECLLKASAIMEVLG